MMEIIVLNKHNQMFNQVLASLNKLISQIDNGELTLDAEQEADLELIFDLILQGGFNSTDIGTYDDSRIRGAFKRLNLIADFGNYLEIQQVAKILNVSRLEIKNLMSEKQILFILMAGRYKIPSFQFYRNKVIPGLDEVIIALNEEGMGFWGSCLFLLSPHNDLVIDGEIITPLDAIKNGRIKYVLKLVGDIGD